jgi:hypothetical protein
MMGDIAQTSDISVTLQLEVIAQAPIERVEVRNGPEVIETLRAYTAKDLGDRIRVIWCGADRKGRASGTHWKGRADFSGAEIKSFAEINAWNPERLFEQQGNDRIVWEAVTTGDFGGFDVWLDDSRAGNLQIETNHVCTSLPLNKIALEDEVLSAGGLDREIRVFRLPDRNQHRDMQETIEVPLRPEGDNPLWVCVTTEDGHQAWSSPIYLFRGTA